MIDAKSEEKEVIEAKEEVIDAKSEEKEVIEAKEELIKANLNEDKSKAKISKKEKARKDK